MMYHNQIVQQSWNCVKCWIRFVVNQMMRVSRNVDIAYIRNLSLKVSNHKSLTSIPTAITQLFSLFMSVAVHTEVRVASRLVFSNSCPFPLFFIETPLVGWHHLFLSLTICIHAEQRSDAVGVLDLLVITITVGI